MTHRLPNGDGKEFDKQINKILSEDDILKKEVIMAGDFNMNLLDIEENDKVRNFVNIVIGNSVMLIINKLTCATKKTATTIDHVFITSVTTPKLKTEIIKSNISNNFPVFSVADYNINIKETKECYISCVTLLIFPWNISSTNCAL